MKIFALNQSKRSLNENVIEKLGELGEVVYSHEKKPVLEISGITDPNSDKILVISPLFVDWKLPNEILDAIPKLKAVIVTSTSFSWLDIDHLAQKGIPVMTGGTYSTNAVAEGAIMLAMLTARKFPMIIQNDWTVDYSEHLGFELSEKRAGIVGLGHIGRRVGELASGMGMDVNYWSRSSRDDRFKYLELDELLQSSDVIFVTLAANEETTRLLTDGRLRLMKKSAIFVSVTHEIYNHELLLQMVKDGKLFGYANEEKDLRSDKLKTNVWTGFASIWYTQESLDRNAQIIIQAVKDAVEGKFPLRVN